MTSTGLRVASMSSETTDPITRSSVRVPESPSPEERELYERLSTLHRPRGRERLE
jgi:hypothetical protein